MKGGISCPAISQECVIDTTVFAIICIIGLTLFSAMLAIRLSAGGAPRRVIVLLLAELWGSFALLAVALVSVSKLLGPAENGTPSGELLALATRWRRLPSAHEALAAVVLLLAAGLFVQALLTIRKAHRNYPL